MKTAIKKYKFTTISKENDIVIKISKFEVTNQQYREFLASDLNHEQYRYDSLIWETKFPKNKSKPYTFNYHHHPVFATYPTLSIPYEGALAYCHWLTTNYNAKKGKKITILFFDFRQKKR